MLRKCSEMKEQIAGQSKQFWFIFSIYLDSGVINYFLGHTAGLNVPNNFFSMAEHVILYHFCKL